jgi:hypothetical protein
MSYNGWTNYATWRVNLEMIDGSKPSDYLSGGFRQAHHLAFALRQRVEGLITEGSTGPAVEYALAFIDDVNWRELAERMMPDPEPEDEDEDEDELVD